MSWNFEELVMTNDNYVLRFSRWIADRIIDGVSRNPGGMEHVFVTGHGHGLLAHVFGLQTAIKDRFLKLQGSSGNGGSSLGRIPSLPVVPEGIEVGDIWDNRISGSEIASFVPPVYYPALIFGILGSCYQSVL